MGSYRKQRKTPGNKGLKKVNASDETGIDDTGGEHGTPTVQTKRVEIRKDTGIGKTSPDLREPNMRLANGLANVPEALVLQVREFWRTRCGTMATLVTSAGASTAFFTSIRLWEELHERGKTLKIDDIRCQTDVISLLFRGVFRNEEDLKISAKSPEQRYRTFARQAFQSADLSFVHTTTTDATQRTARFFPDFLLLVVADRLAWSTEKQGLKDERPLPLPHKPPVNLMDKTVIKDKQSGVDKLQKLLKHTFLQWDDAVGQYVERWKGRYGVRCGTGSQDRTSKKGCASARFETVSGGDEESASLPSLRPIRDVHSQGNTTTSVHEEGLRVLHSLVDRILGTIEEVHVSKVENTFCQAAIGLFGLALVCRPKVYLGRLMTPSTDGLYSFSA